MDNDETPDWLNPRTPKTGTAEYAAYCAQRAKHFANPAYPQTENTQKMADLYRWKAVCELPDIESKN